MKNVWRQLVGGLLVGALLCFSSGCCDKCGKCHSCHRTEKCDSCSGGTVIEKSDK
jgi:hypothetical protein